jgi:hypothetical protein
VVPFHRRNFVTGRFEWSQRDELFAYSHELEHEIAEKTGKRAFEVAAYTAGYTRDFDLFRNAQTGLGANFTMYNIASALKPFYGDHPFGVNVFVRMRVRATE